MGRGGLVKQIENSSSGFKIKSLAKTTACEQELGVLLDLPH